MRNVWYGKLFHLFLDLYDIKATIVLSNIEQVSIEFQNSICQNGWAITVSIQPVWIFRPNIGQFQNVCNEKLFCMLLDLFDIKPKIVYNSIEKVSSEFKHSISQNEWAITVFIHPVWILRPNIGQFRNGCNEKLFCLLLDLFDMKTPIVYNSIVKVSSEFQDSISQNECAITVSINPVWIFRAPVIERSSWLVR